MIYGYDTPISIPYGSIKRVKLRISHIRCVISIPYGSIKSGRKKELDAPLIYFNSLWFN